MVILNNKYIMLHEEMKFTASTSLFISYNCVAKYLTFKHPQFKVRILNSFFREDNDVASGPTGPSLCSQHSKQKIKDIGQPFMTYPAL